MIQLSVLADELKAKTEYQETPRQITSEEYTAAIVYGLKRLYIDTGRASAWSDDLIDNGTFTEDLLIDEIEYVLIMAQMRFFQIVRASVNEMVSYTTNALSVTQGDKPYQNITGTLNELENERRILYYKMVRFALGENG